VTSAPPVVHVGAGFAPIDVFWCVQAGFGVKYPHLTHCSPIPFGEQVSFEILQPFTVVQLCVPSAFVTHVCVNAEIGCVSSYTQREHFLNSSPAVPQVAAVLSVHIAGKLCPSAIVARLCVSLQFALSHTAVSFPAVVQVAVLPV